MPRFYFNACLQAGRAIEFHGDEATHALLALRLSNGDTIDVIDGKGSIANCSIECADTKRKTFQAVVQKVVKISPVLPALTIFASFPKGNRCRVMVEKLAELGACGYTPLISNRTVKIPHNWEHVKNSLDNIAVSALKQSGSPFLLTINEPVNLTKIPHLPFDVKLVCVTEEEARDKTDAITALKFDSANSVAVVIGPEGGFEKEELALMFSNEFRPVRLGENILRIETAAIVVAGLFHSRFFV